MIINRTAYAIVDCKNAQGKFIPRSKFRQFLKEAKASNWSGEWEDKALVVKEWDARDGKPTDINLELFFPGQVKVYQKPRPFDELAAAFQKGELTVPMKGIKD